MGLFDFLRRIFAPGPIVPDQDSPSTIEPGSLAPPLGSVGENSAEDQSFPVQVFHPDPQQASASPPAWPELSAPLPSASNLPPENSAHSVVTPPDEPNTPSDEPDTKSSGFHGLDAERFQPLSQSEAMDATAQPGWRNAYWDPLNVIPSADLPRIRVIDQTMIGMGLIDAEELAEIHEIGRRMSGFRTDGHAIVEAGQQAVNQSEAAREARKLEMKQRAAARRDARQKQIAHRKATDIVFLGRGVSKGLADRRSNIERLTDSELPVLATPADLAEAMGVSIGTLRWLAFHHPATRTTHYHHWKVPKRSGGERTISRPHQKLEAAQRWILDNILAKRKTHDAAHGFVPECSTLTGALPHVGSEVLVNVDLQDFFPTIDFARIAGLFRAMGYSPAVATILSLLCTEAPRRVIRSRSETLYVALGHRSLPQGACTSPALSNLICYRLDRRLTGVSKSIGWRYSRYADDMSFSCPSSSVEDEAGSAASQKVGYLLSRVRHLTNEEGFQVKESKTRVLRRSARQTVTGIVVNDRPSIDRKTIRRVRAILHRAKQEGLEAQNRDGHPNFSAWVCGMIAYVQMVNPQQGRKLHQQFEQL